MAKKSYDVQPVQDLAVLDITKEYAVIVLPITGKNLSKTGKTRIAYTSGGFKPLGMSDMRISVNITRPK